MMNADDIHAFGPPPAAAPHPTTTLPPAVPRRRRWPWVLAMVALVLLCTVATALWLGHEVLRALPEPGAEGWRVVIDGEEVGLLQGGSPLAVGLALAGAGLVVVVVLGLALPLVLVLAAGAVVLALLLGALSVGVVLAAGLGLATLALVAATSPLWLPVLLLVWLLVWLLRRRAPAVPTASSAT